MFGLRQQIRGHKSRARRVIGNDQHFGGARRQVNRCALRIGSHLLFGGRDPGIAGAEDFVDLRNRAGAEGQGRDRLRATDLENRINAAQLRGHQHRRVRTAIARRGRAQHAPRAARQSRRHPQHDHRGGQGRGACRHIQAHRIDRAGNALATNSGRGFQRQRRQPLGGVECLDISDRALQGADLFSESLARAAANSAAPTASASRRTPSKRKVSSSNATSPSARTLADEPRDIRGNISPGCKCRARQRRSALHRIQFGPL